MFATTLIGQVLKLILLTWINVYMYMEKFCGVLRHYREFIPNCVCHPFSLPSTFQSRLYQSVSRTRIRKNKEQKNSLSLKTLKHLKVSLPFPGHTHTHTALFRLPTIEAILLLTQLLTHRHRHTCTRPFVVTQQNRCWPDACLTHTEETHVNTHTQWWGKYSWHMTRRVNICFEAEKERDLVSIALFLFLWTSSVAPLLSASHTIDSLSPSLSLLSLFPHSPSQSIFHCVVICAPPPFINFRDTHTLLLTFVECHPPYHRNILSLLNFWGLGCRRKVKITLLCSPSSH